MKTYFEKVCEKVLGSLPQAKIEKKDAYDGLDYTYQTDVHEFAVRLVDDDYIPGKYDSTGEYDNFAVIKLLPGFKLNSFKKPRFAECGVGGP